MLWHKFRGLVIFDFFSRAMIFMDQIIKRNNRARFQSLWGSLNWLTDWRFVHDADRCSVRDSDSLDVLGEMYERARMPAYMVKDSFQVAAGADWGRGAAADDPRVAYVYRCLGHRVHDRVFFPWPKLCVLVALVLERGRWRAAEDVIALDDLACYFYSRLVLRGGRLPGAMHSSVVMRSFLCVSPAIRGYLAGFTAQKNGL